MMAKMNAEVEKRLTINTITSRNVTEYARFT